MRARSADYLTSAANAAGFASADLPEVAFAGRSNVGKSSLLNQLCGQRSLARVSRTPGRTQLVNWFRVMPPKGEDIYFVDLPGYGYAKVPNRVKMGWGPLIEAYLQDRPTLRLTLVLIDIRRGPQIEEEQLIEFLQTHDLPHTVVLTKADKLGKSQRGLAVQKSKKSLGLKNNPVAFSAQDGSGVADLWRLVMRYTSE